MKLSSLLVLCLCVVGANGADVVPGFPGSKELPITPLVAKVCKGSTNPESCKQGLSGDPISKDADLPMLSLISFRATMHGALFNAQIISKIQQNKTLGVDEANCYNNCSDLYSGAVEALDNSVVDLLNKRYTDAKLKVLIANKNALQCDNCFTAIKQKPRMITAITKTFDETSMIGVLVLKALEAEPGAGAKH